MLVIEPTAQQHRAAAFALVLMAALTAAVIAATWVATFDGPLLLPIFVAYLLFNFGFLFTVMKSRLQTKGARLGVSAVLLNVLAMFLSDFETIWTALSALSMLGALLAAYMLFKDARASRA